MWIPAAHPAARDGAVSLEQLASLQVIYEPRRSDPVTYDAWTTAMQTANQAWPTPIRRPGNRLRPICLAGRRIRPSGRPTERAVLFPHVTKSACNPLTGVAQIE